MRPTELCPKARSGLVSTDHSKRGNRLLSILDPATGRVSLLENWEYAVLLLCDGKRTQKELHALVQNGPSGEPVTAASLAYCLAYFDKEGLIEPLRANNLGPPGPVTLVGLEQARLEWQRQPRAAGAPGSQSIAPPLADAPVDLAVGLGPTVALLENQPVVIGTQLVVTSCALTSGGSSSVRPQELGTTEISWPEPATEVGAPRRLAPLDASNEAPTLRHPAPVSNKTMRLRGGM